jgi:6-phosphogluconate dehydrogenase
LPLLKPFGPSGPLNLKASIPEISAELSKTYQPLKKIYATCIQTDAVAPAVGATLEYFKAVGGENLPTDFEEMELDCESALVSNAGVITDVRLWSSQL